MNEPRFLPATLRIALALACLPACSSRPSASPTTAAPATPTPPVPTPVTQMVLPAQPPDTEHYQWSNARTPDTPAWKLLEKVLEATGGPAAVDGVKTLVSKGKAQMRTPAGTYEATVTSTFVWPNKVRREVVLPGGMVISTTFTPGQAWISGALGNVELPPAERRQLEDSAMRTPLALLKARGHRLFWVALGDPSVAGGEKREVLVIRLAGETTEAILDADHRIVELSWEGQVVAPEGKKKRNVLRYSDFRTVEGLVYPFSSEAFTGDENVSSLIVDSLHVNEPVPPELFEPPMPSPSPTPTPPPAATPR